MQMKKTTFFHFDFQDILYFLNLSDPLVFRVNFLPGTRKIRFLGLSENVKVTKYSRLYIELHDFQKNVLFKTLSSTWKTVYFVTFSVSDELKTYFFEFLAKN